jgi:hypothetical protein
MRIYIIGNDGITLCREPPAAVSKGEIVVASTEELHAAPLSGKRLLALWNALPGVEKRRKVGDRAALIDRLWSTIEALPEPEPQSDRFLAHIILYADFQSLRPNGPYVISFVLLHLAIVR